ncbi:utrophin-like [Stegostoma tigrinum]|uniref:utrophin-like n=1 Tax=Stegostoma tigrinum TaxID=3053191 RepID=UPI00287011FD|nr:utrophin-like [Stegostoma tigrinum]
MEKDQELLQAVKTEDVAAMQKLLQRPKQGKAMDLLELHTAQRVFDQHKLTQTEQLLNVTEVINCLTSIYDVLEQNHKDLVNVPLCVDMCLNWLLNVFDTQT